MKFMITIMNEIHKYKTEWNSWIQEWMKFINTRMNEIHEFKTEWNSWIQEWKFG